MLHLSFPPISDICDEQTIKQLEANIHKQARSQIENNTNTGLAACSDERFKSSSLFHGYSAQLQPFSTL
jgi:hypothetical protein